MIVAILFPATLSRVQVCYPNSYLATINQFICNLTRYVEKVFVFELPGYEQAKNLSQHLHPSNLFFLSTAELSKFFCSQSVDIWHDFGYYSAGTLADMRAAHSQKFYITVDVPGKNLLETSSSRGVYWDGCDAAVYSSHLFSELGKTTRIHQAAAFSERHSDLKVCTIPLGLDIPMINPLPKTEARCLLGFAEDETIILCYIELTSSSQVDLLLLIDIFCDVGRMCKKARFVISGPDPQQLVKQLKNNVLNKMSGQIVFLPNPVPYVVPLLFSAADIFVQPSDCITNDSLITTIYAMAHRLAVIMPGYSIASTLIENHKSGILISSYSNRVAIEHIQWTIRFAPIQLTESLVKHARGINSEEMVASLCALVDDPSSRYRLGNAAYERASKCNNLKWTIKKYLKLWTTLLQQPNTSFIKLQNLNYEPIWEDFLHSISPPLDTTRKLYITKLGKEVMHKKLRISTRLEFKHILNGLTIIKILKMGQYGASIESITESLNIGESVGDSTLQSGILYHIGWCLNQGLLTSLPEELQR